MKKELALHTLFSLALINFFALAKGFTSFSYWQLWAGGLFGSLLADTDHLIYVYLLRPYEFVSQKFIYFVKNKQYYKALDFLAQTKHERTKRIFHTVIFQAVFLVLTFWIITSSTSYFGIGLVIAFYMHFILDQLVDFFERGNLSDWFDELGISLDTDRQIIFWTANLIIFLLIVFLG